MGIVVRAKPNVDRYLCKWDGDERCVDGCWLEPYPGTFSLGFNRILALTYPFYGLGPCVSDSPHACVAYTSFHWACVVTTADPASKYL